MPGNVETVNEILVAAEEASEVLGAQAVGGVQVRVARRRAAHEVAHGQRLGRLQENKEIHEWRRDHGWEALNQKLEFHPRALSSEQCRGRILQHG